MSEPADLTLKRCEAAVDAAIERGKITVADAAAWRKGARAGADVRPGLALMRDDLATAAANQGAIAADPAMKAIMASFALPSAPQTPGAVPPPATANSGRVRRQAPSASVAADEAAGEALARGLCFASDMPPSPGNGATLGRIGAELATAEVGS